MQQNWKFVIVCFWLKCTLGVVVDLSLSGFMFTGLNLLAKTLMFSNTVVHLLLDDSEGQNMWNSFFYFSTEHFSLPVSSLLLPLYINMDLQMVFSAVWEQDWQIKYRGELVQWHRLHIYLNYFGFSITASEAAAIACNYQRSYCVPPKLNKHSSVLYLAVASLGEH